MAVNRRPSKERLNLGPGPLGKTNLGGTVASGPITFAGSSNYSHGYEKMAVFEAQANLKYKMVSDGLVSGF